MQKEIIQKICAVYTLGDVTSVEQIHGGLVHRLWKLTTSSGIYAVKELRKDMRERSNAYQEFGAAENIAQYFAAKGIPAVCALRHQNEVIFHDGHFSVSVYPWIEAHPQAWAIINTTHSQKVALLLGGIHHAGSGFPDRKPLRHILVNDAQWIELEGLAKQSSDIWKTRFLAILPTIQAWNSRFPAAYAQLSQSLVTSHRDLNTKNILWDSEDQAHIVDWESAGSTNQTLELIGAVIEWSMLPDQTLDEANFREFLQKYRSVSPIVIKDIEAAFLCKMSEWLDWFKFNIERATLEKFADEKAIGLDEIDFSLQLFEVLFANVATYIAWAQEEAQ